MCGKQQLRTAGGVEYVLQRKKVKRINLRLRPDGTAAVSAPSWVPAEQIDQFVASHAEWVCRAREKAARRAEALAVPPPDAEQCRAVFAAADAVVWPLVAGALGNRRPEIRVRDMKTRWGGAARHSTASRWRPASRRSPLRRWSMCYCMSMCIFSTPTIRLAFGT